MNTTTAIPSDSNQEPEGTCPACGYFVGIASTCIRCGARTHKRISLRIIRWGSVIGSILGIALLWYAAYTKTPHLVKVSDIDEMMNGALVKVAGRVASAVEDQDKNGLKLKVDDGTGEINISAFNKLAQFKKVLGDKMPKLGDEIEVTGVLSENQKFGVSMFLTIPDRIKILKKYELKSMKIGELTKDLIGSVVKLRASVSSYDKISTRNGGVLHKIVLDDGSGAIDMTLFDQQMSDLPESARNLLTGGGNTIELVVKIGALLLGSGTPPPIFSISTSSLSSHSG